MMRFGTDNQDLDLPDTSGPSQNEEQPGDAFKSEFGTNRKARRKQAKRDRMQARREARFQRMLETADLVQARIFWADHHHSMATDHALLVGLHRLRLERPGISEELRAQSLVWLANNKA